MMQKNAMRRFLTYVLVGVGIRGEAYSPVCVAIDFDASMRYTAARFARMDSVWERPLYGLFKNLYEHTNLTKVSFSFAPKIPKIIHHIWLGSPVPPAEYEVYRTTWLHYHPDWEYRLWTDQEVEACIARGELFTPELLQFYREAVNYAEKADILRYAILYTYGGLYTDLSDYECLQPFDIFHHCYDFYAGLSSAAGQSGLFVNNALIGAAPGHPILKYCLDTLREHRDISLVIARTGPLHFTRACAVIAAAQQGGIIGIFPKTFFYPRERDDALEDREKWLMPESWAVHHWTGSWRLKGTDADKKAFARQFSAQELKKYVADQPIFIEHWSKPILVKDDCFIASQNCGTWWYKSIDKVISFEEFEQLVGGIDMPSRVAVRAHVKACGYTSILDVPCGLCLDYKGFKNDGFTGIYRGIDINTALVCKARREGLPVIQASIEDIPYLDNSFDLVYARFILEHLDAYQKAVQELLRVARKEVLIVFRNGAVQDIERDAIQYVEVKGSFVYLNIYARHILEAFLREQPRVKSLTWESVEGNEYLLHVYLW